MRRVAAAVLLLSFACASVRPGRAQSEPGPIPSGDAKKTVTVRKAPAFELAAPCKRAPDGQGRRMAAAAVLPPAPAAPASPETSTELTVPKYLRSFLRGAPHGHGDPPA